MKSINHYKIKPNEYFNAFRKDILGLIPPETKRMLDVGCGNGTTALMAKEHLEIQEVIGIEFFEPAAKVAKGKLDAVILGDIEKIELDFPTGYFDCIICADILEHLIDPWYVINKLKEHLTKDGVMILSLPNLRHIVPILKIITNRFEYEESGILDRTHLRFFTLYTIREMLSKAGFKIDKLDSKKSISLKFKLLNLFSFGFLRPFSIYQYIIVAKKM
jgi:O-antigen biosynthesis protein